MIFIILAVLCALAFLAIDGYFLIYLTFNTVRIAIPISNTTSISNYTNLTNSTSFNNLTNSSDINVQISQNFLPKNSTSDPQFKDVTKLNSCTSKEKVGVIMDVVGLLVPILMLIGLACNGGGGGLGPILGFFMVGGVILKFVGLCMLLDSAIHLDSTCADKAAYVMNFLFMLACGISGGLAAATGGGM